MAAAETVTVFLETSLGTRLVVSFPARATTVADLKRQVSAEHATNFPGTGPIAVTSLQIKLDGSWFLLTDSMAVQAAFEWVKGPRRLLVEAHKLRPHSVTRKDAKCGTVDSEPNAVHPVLAENSSQYMLPPAEAPGGGNHASGNGSSDTTQLKNRQDEGITHASGSCQREDGITMLQESSDLDFAVGDNGTPLASQEDKPQECVEHASGQLEDGITMPQESSHLDSAACDSDTQLENQEDKLQGCVEHDFDCVMLEDGITMPPESSHFDLGTGVNDNPLPNHEDKPQRCIEHASGQLEDGITLPQESSGSDLAAGDDDTPPTNQHDKFHGGDEHTSGHSEGRTTIPQDSSNLGVASYKENDRAGDQQKDIIVEPRGKKRFREEDNADGSIVANCYDNLSSFASPTPKFVFEKRSSVIKQEKLDSAPLLYNFEDYYSHGLGVKPSGVCNGESSNNGSAIPPCADSMGRDKSSGKEVMTHRGDKEEPQIAECHGNSSCKRTDVPHSVESMKEDNNRQASNGHYLDNGKNEGATSTVRKKHEPCVRRSHQRVVVRKVAMSRAMKVYSFRC